MQLEPSGEPIQYARDALKEAFGEGYLDRRLGIAVSGGGDSMAMLHCLASILPGENIEVVTINHNLRPDAAEEVALVRKVCTSLGVSCVVRNWQWDQVGNLQASARDGRWAAIKAFVDEEGLDAVAVGHTEDDQIENFFLRLARGSGVDGLSGMSVLDLRDGFKVVRPMLHCARQDLRDWMSHKGLSWADDPSNIDEKYDRVRARGMLKELDGLGLTRKRVLQTVAHMRSASAVLSAAQSEYVTANCWTECGDVLIAAPDGSSAETEVFNRTVMSALQWVGGGSYRPRLDSFTAALATVRGGTRCTIRGCVLSLENNRLRIGRELAATQPLSVTNASGTQIWDGRWALEAPVHLNEFEIRALGEDGLAYCLNWRQIGVPRATLLTTPSVWSNGSLIAAPIAGYGNGWSARIVADFEEWLVTH